MLVNRLRIKLLPTSTTHVVQTVMLGHWALVSHSSQMDCRSVFLPICLNVWNTVYSAYPLGRCSAILDPCLLGKEAPDHEEPMNRGQTSMLLQSFVFQSKAGSLLLILLVSVIGPRCRGWTTSPCTNVDEVFPMRTFAERN